MSEEKELGPLDPSKSWVAHLYRGEIHRMKLWRERMDRTTNWAVITMAGILTWSFSNPSHPHYMLIGGMVATMAFLNIESRRYRGHELWRTRVRTLQKNVIAPNVDPELENGEHSWRKELAESYRNPKITLSYGQAIAHRLQRIYMPLFMILLVSWIIRVTAFSPQQWPSSAAIGMIPGIPVTAAVLMFNLGLILCGYWPKRDWEMNGELKEELY